MRKFRKIIIIKEPSFYWQELLDTRTLAKLMYVIIYIQYQDIKRFTIYWRICHVTLNTINSCSKRSEIILLCQLLLTFKYIYQGGKNSDDEIPQICKDKKIVHISCITDNIIS